MTATTGIFSDLGPRAISAVVLAAVLIYGAITGGWIFQFMLMALAGLMMWELSTILGQGTDRRFRAALGLMAAGAIALTVSLPAAGDVIVLCGVVAFAAYAFGRDRAIYAVFAAAILFALNGFSGLRFDAGLTWCLWLALVVVGADVGGYFAGRMIGGPKILPVISPKKTWSGTVGGIILASIVGLIFALFGLSGIALVGLSALLAIASQIGDVCESALKRRAGVKDSSNLIPGHGGVLDRFDGMVGAGVVLAFYQLSGGFSSSVAQ